MQDPNSDGLHTKKSKLDSNRHAFRTEYEMASLSQLGN